MEELKDDIKKVGRETKEKVEEKINVASEFVTKVKQKEYIFSGDALIGAGVAVGGALLALVAKSVSLDKKNDKLEKKLDETWYHNGILVGRLAELRSAEEKRIRAVKDARIRAVETS